jgi:hypothetical protein
MRDVMMDNYMHASNTSLDGKSVVVDAAGAIYASNTSKYEPVSFSPSLSRALSLFLALYLSPTLSCSLMISFSLW